MVVKQNGAVNAPFRQVFGRERIFLGEPTPEMVYWFYSTPNTTDVFYDPIDDRTAVVVITEKVGDNINCTSITIGQKEKDFICHNYLYYHPDIYTRSPQGYNVLEMRKEG
jgi:hypothetical protein